MKKPSEEKNYRRTARRIFFGILLGIGIAAFLWGGMSLTAYRISLSGYGEGQASVEEALKIVWKILG